MIRELIEILSTGKYHLLSLQNGREIVNAGTIFGDREHDITLCADQSLGTRIAQRLLHDLQMISRVTIEGQRDIVEHSQGESWAIVDPIDGSLNYASGQHFAGAPYTACVTILSQHEGATFGDVVATGIIDLRRNVDDVWIAESTSNGYRAYIKRGRDDMRSLRHAYHKTLDIGKMTVLADTHYAETRALCARIFADGDGSVRSYGSSSYEMAMVASGGAVAFISSGQKHHELGAGFALIRGAGGVVVDFDGKSIETLRYDPNARTPIICAVNQAIANQLLERINGRTS